MDNRSIFLYHLGGAMGGRSGVDQPTIGSVGAKPVGVEVGVKRPTEPRGDGGALSQKWLSPVA